MLVHYMYLSPVLDNLLNYLKNGSELYGNAVL